MPRPGGEAPGYLVEVRTDGIHIYAAELAPLTHPRAGAHEAVRRELSRKSKADFERRRRAGPAKDGVAGAAGAGAMDSGAGPRGLGTPEERHERQHRYRKATPLPGLALAGLRIRAV